MGKIVSVYEHFGLRTFRFTNDLQERIMFVNRGLAVLVLRLCFFLHAHSPELTVLALFSVPFPLRILISFWCFTLSDFHVISSVLLS